MAHHLERTNTTSTPPLPWDSNEKTQKCRWRRQNALRRFLVTSAMIGHKYAPDFDGVHPQGVHSDSLESFKSMGGVQGGGKPALCAFLARAASAIILYVL
jgi:hypothetical protein